MTEIEELERRLRVCASDYDELQAQLYACQVRLAAAEKMAEAIEYVGGVGYRGALFVRQEALARYRSTQPEQQHKEQAK